MGSILPVQCSCCEEDPEGEESLLHSSSASRTHSGLATPDDDLLHVRARGITDTQIRVEWTQLLDEYHSHPYKVRYRRKDKKKKLGGIVSDYKSVRVMEGNSVVLRNLKPDEQYEIGVADKSLPPEEQEYTTCYAWTMPTRRLSTTTPT